MIEIEERLLKIKRKQIAVEQMLSKLINDVREEIKHRPPKNNFGTIDENIKNKRFNP